MKRTVVGILIAAFAVTTAAAPKDAEIRRILTERVDAQKRGVGIVVGVIDSSGRRVVSHGTFAADDPRRVDGDTLFEIGSVTKVFNALLVADAVARGEVALSDPIAKYLPKQVKVPQRGASQITLESLATHRSGLPRLPANLAPRDPANPYADYGPEQLYDFLSRYELQRDPGAMYEYSNLGAGLLGHALALRAETSYEALVRKRILEPLRMKQTTIALSSAQQRRLATGHDPAQQAVRNWDFPTLAGAGALRSTANDLLNFLSAMIDPPKSRLGRAMSAQLATKHATGAPNMDVALGWHIRTNAVGQQIVWHNGGTGGYRSFIGFDPKARTGVVVLANMYTDVGVDDIGFHLLDASSPLAEAPKVRTSIALDPNVFDRYAGRYELSPAFALVLSREGTRFFVQATGQPKLEIFAESQTKFFLNVVEAQLTVIADGEGRGEKLILHQGGRDQVATRTP